MNFFKSVFTDDPESSSSDPESDEPQIPQNPEKSPLLNEIDPSSSSSSSTGNWSFGGIIKTLASKSEVVIQNYQKGLEEFSSELKKETEVIRKAVKDLPASLEVGASVAQESLESVGQAIDNLGNTVSGIITHGKDVLLNDNNQDSSDSDNNYGSSSVNNSRGYSRFDLLIRGVQTDLNTYCEELEDLDEFDKWKSGFVLGEKDEEIDDLFNENGEMESVYRKLVPKTISDEMFWSRYFYKVYKLKQVEEARANLVRRAISGEDEDLSWDVDDDEEEEGVSNVVMPKGESGTSGSSGLVEKEKPVAALVGSSDIDGDDKIEEKNVDKEVVVEKEQVVQSETGQDEAKEERSSEEKLDLSELNDENVAAKSEEKLSSDEKSDQVESCKDSDVSVVSTQPSLPEEEDLSWDEIEDLSSIDQRKGSVSSDSPNKVDLRKRLSVADDDEDLSWDIEDDD